MLSASSPPPRSLLSDEWLAFRRAWRAAAVLGEGPSLAVTALLPCEKELRLEHRCKAQFRATIALAASASANAALTSVPGSACAAGERLCRVCLGPLGADSGAKDDAAAAHAACASLYLHMRASASVAAPASALSSAAPPSHSLSASVSWLPACPWA